MSAISCLICYECYFPSSDVSSTPCGHLFHSKCIRKWFQSNDKNECPQCKNKVKNCEIQKIYFSGAEFGDEKEENDSAQRLLETIFDIACEETSHNKLANMIKKNVCFECRRPVKKSEKCMTLQKAYHCVCQPYFLRDLVSRIQHISKTFSDLAILTPRAFCLYGYMKKCYCNFCILVNTGLRATFPNFDSSQVSMSLR